MVLVYTTVVLVYATMVLVYATMVLVYATPVLVYATMVLVYATTVLVRWGTTDDFTTGFLHFSLFPTALWDLANSRPVHSLMLSFHLFFFFWFCFLSALSSSPLALM